MSGKWKYTLFALAAVAPISVAMWITGKALTGWRDAFVWLVFMYALLQGAMSRWAQRRWLRDAEPSEPLTIVGDERITALTNQFVEAWDMDALGRRSVFALVQAARYSGAIEARQESARFLERLGVDPRQPGVTAMTRQHRGPVA